MYIDEVGNPDLESSENPLHRFLSLTGVIVDLAYVSKTLFPQVEKLKFKYFKSHPDDPVIFHRKELVNAKHPFEALRNEKVKNQFDNELLNYLKMWNYTVITVCLDKKAHKDTYRVWRYDPYHYCLALLLERFTFFLEQKEARGDVMAESRGGKEDRRLKASFSKLWEEGTEYLSPERFHSVFTSKQLKVKPKSNNISGLQIADIIAHPSRKEILSENDLLDRPLGTLAKNNLLVQQGKYLTQQGENLG